MRDPKNCVEEASVEGTFPLDGATEDGSHVDGEGGLGGVTLSGRISF